MLSIATAIKNVLPLEAGHAMLSSGGDTSAMTRRISLVSVMKGISGTGFNIMNMISLMNTLMKCPLCREPAIKV